MKKAGLTPQFSMQDIDNYIKAFAEQAEEKIYITLQAAGEMFVKYARESGLYNDITGNLRSSIGYVIAKDGNIETSNFEKQNVGSEGDAGVQKATRLAQDLVTTHNVGLTLIGVAGMEYAVYVEAMESKDVITGASMKAAEWLRTAVKTVMDKAQEDGRI